MIPEHNSNPFDNPAFRLEMTTLLEKTVTPLSMQVGELKTTVDGHEEWINQQRGGGAMLRHLYTAFIAAVSGLLAGWFGRH